MRFNEVYSGQICLFQMRDSSRVEWILGRVVDVTETSGDIGYILDKAFGIQVYGVEGKPDSGQIIPFPLNPFVEEEVEILSGAILTITEANDTMQGIFTKVTSGIQIASASQMPRTPATH